MMSLFYRITSLSHPSMPKYILLSFLLYLAFSPDLAARCLSVQDNLHPCRYPAGDSWCNQRNLPPYAYRDNCNTNLPQTQGLIDSSSSNRATPQPMVENSSRYALVIGNATYSKESPLKNTINDARDISAMLGDKLGFDVTNIENSDHREMRRTINTFLDEIRAMQGIAVIYYSGHAVQDSYRVNYLLPVDAQINQESHIRSDGISINSILDQFDKRPDGSVSILILDACRNNPFSIGRRGGTRGLARVGNPPGGTLVLYAASPGQTADDNISERNGLFTKYILEKLPRPGLDIEDAFEQVALAVKASSGNRQIPYKEGNLLGKHFLSRKPQEIHTRIR